MPAQKTKTSPLADDNYRFRKRDLLRHASSFSRAHLLIVVVVFAAIGSYLLYHTFAAGPLVASLEAEQMSMTPGSGVITDTTASAGKSMLVSGNGTVSGSVIFPGSVTSVSVTAKGTQCQGAPAMNVAVDGINLLTGTSVGSSSWGAYSAGANLSPGTHSLSISFTNDNSYSKRHGHTVTTCSRDLYLDITNFYGPVVVTPVPTVALSVSPTSVAAGSASTLTWNSTNATSCTASGAWNGAEPTSGSASTGAINQNSEYTLTCNGPGGSAVISKTVSVANLPPPSSTSSIYWGAYIEGSETYNYYYGGTWGNTPWDGNTWNKFETNAGKKVSLIHYGQPPPWAQTTFYTGVADIATSRGALNMIDMGQSGSDNLTTMVSGGYDASIKTWAANVKAWGKPFMLRPWWEMNGTWYSWGKEAAANPALYVSAWRHWHDVVVAAGATNVTWVWCPNLEFSGSTPLSQLYPGDGYVDWTCLDGYNKGTSSMSFTSLYQQSYNDLLAIAPTKPIMIGEISSLEYGTGVKAAWTTDALTNQIPKNFPKIKAMVWFNWRIYEQNNGVYADQPFPIESSADSQAAFKTAISSGYYAPAGSNITNLPTLTKVQPLP